MSQQSKYYCDSCSIFCQDNYDLNKHFATKGHLKRAIELDIEITPIDITKLTTDEEDIYLINHPYYRQYIENADNLRKKLNEEYYNLYAQLGLKYCEKKQEWIPINYKECLTDKEISKLVNDRYPYDDEDEEDKYSEERFKYRISLEGSRNLTFEQKEEIRNKIDDILIKQNNNYNQNLNPKLLGMYKNNARNRLISEFKQYKIKSIRDAEKEAKQQARQQAKEIEQKAKQEARDAERIKKLEAKMKYLQSLQ